MGCLIIHLDKQWKSKCIPHRSLTATFFRIGVIKCLIFNMTHNTGSYTAFLGISFIVFLFLDYCGAQRQADTSHLGQQLVNTSQWIVLTTIQYPTDAVKKLAMLPEWRVVVVADTKTPADWALENVHFLGLEQQAQLPYRIAQEGRLPFKSYA